MNQPPRPSRSLPLFLALGAAAVAFGIAHALRLRWTADDPYLSFRYAEQLVRGHGLVFNPGERVEGYTNFLWTLWSALGLRLGFAAEPWADAWSIASYAGTLVLLCRVAWRGRAADGPALPVAAWMFALQFDAASYATSGLETAAFTLLAVGGYVLLTGARVSARRAIAGGVVLALCALTRPDGAIFAACGLVLLLVRRVGARSTAAYVGALVLLLAPYAAWKLSYYGDLFPNTYYAKSAFASWYSQGARYLATYLEKYWVMVPGALLAIGVMWRGWRSSDATARGATRAAAGALAVAGVYVFSVVRVGGDFMFARLLIPATPFALIAIEHGVTRLRVPAAARIAAAAAFALAFGLTVRGPGAEIVHGIVDERAFYQSIDRDSVRTLGLRLAKSFEGVPVRMAFTGGQAILAYESHADYADEISTGLTDPYIARQPLERRSRAGHEKWTPFNYLIETPRADFVMFTNKWLGDTLSQYVPLIVARIDGGVVTMLNWRPAVVESLRARGAEIPEFTTVLDGLIEQLPRLSDDDVAQVYEKTRRFYFRNANDPGREAPFLARLGERARTVR